MSATYTLTKNQHEVLQFIKTYYETNGYAPSMEEIAENFSIRISTVQDYLTRLINKGAIIKEPGKARAIRFKESVPQNLSISLPITGTLSQAMGIRSVSVLDLVEVPSKMITEMDKFYCLQVKGFDFMEERLADGDILVMRKQNDLQDGDIVLAKLKDSDEDKWVIRTFQKKDGQVELKSNNENILPLLIPENEIEVRGIYCGLVRFAF